MTFKFNREIISNAIIVKVLVDDRYRIKMLLDTGASHTTIDSNMLFLFGYNLQNSLETVQNETANGVVDVGVFELKNFKAFGINKPNFQIQVYDFVAHGILSDYNGLLGLDFFEGTKFCIDTIQDEITIHE